MNSDDDPDSNTYSFNIFVLSTNDEKVVLRNNIFYHQGTWDGADPMFCLSRHAGLHVFEAKNWINSNWTELGPDGELTVIGTVTQNSVPLTGSNPGLTNPSGHDFSVPTSSAVHDQAAVLPSSISYPIGNTLNLEH